MYASSLCNRDQKLLFYCHLETLSISISNSFSLAALQSWNQCIGESVTSTNDISTPISYHRPNLTLLAGYTAAPGYSRLWMTHRRIRCGGPARRSDGAASAIESAASHVGSVSRLSVRHRSSPKGFPVCVCHALWYGWIKESDSWFHRKCLSFAASLCLGVIPMKYSSRYFMPFLSLA